MHTILDTSGFYETYFSTPEIRCGTTDNRRSGSGEVSFSTFNYGSIAPEIIDAGMPKVLDDLSITVSVPVNVSLSQELNYNVCDAIFPETYGEYRLKTTIGNYTVAFRGKLGCLRSSGSSQGKLGWKIYYIAGTPSEISQFFTYTWDEIPNTYLYSELYRQIYAYSFTIQSVDCSVAMTYNDTEENGLICLYVYPKVTILSNAGDTYQYYTPKTGYGFGATRDWFGVQPVPVDNKGRWKGLPTSTIPIRSTIRGGVDYRHNIDVFDETNYAARNMFLTNRVGTIPYELVRFTYPNGTIKCNTNLQFTHFLCCSFTDDNNPRVYRVTTYRVISPSIIEYDFTLDYLKDYWQHWGVTSTNAPLVLRTTDKSFWENDEGRYISDTAILDGTMTEEFYTLATLAYAKFPTESDTSGPWVMLSLASGEVITLAYSNYVTSFKKKITDSENGSIIASQLRSIHLIPPHSVLEGFSQPISTYTFSGVDSEGAPASETVTFLDAYMYSPGEQVKLALRLTAPNIVKDWLDADAEWELNIPFYGKIKPSLPLLQTISSGNPTIFQYLVFDVEEGRVAFDHGSTSGIVTEWVELPSIPIPSNANNYLAVQELNTSSKMSAISSVATIAGGVVAAGVGAATGALPVAIGGGAAIVSGFASGVKASVDYDNQRRSIKDSTYSSYSGGGGSASLFDNKILLKKIAPNLNVPLSTYYDRVGYPLQKLWEETGAVTGERYWITFLGTLKGTTEYVEACRTDIERDCLIYNY